VTLLAAGGRGPASVGAPASTLIRNARVIDGSGSAARAADVRIADDRIVAVGRLTPGPADRVIDGGGLALAPGFIDTHSHHDRGLDTAREATAMVSQGVTTIVVGQDGGGIDLAALFGRLERQPAAVNVASYAGHGAIRDRVLGKDFARAATAEEIQRMQTLLAAEMEAGALGLSTGLEYDPGIYSTPAEVLALAKTAGAAGGRYASHIRSEDRWFWDALDELIAIGRQNRMPVHVSHIKLGMHDLWGQASKLIDTLDRARAAGVQLTADIYPYTYWQSNLGVLYPKRNFADRAETEALLAELAEADGDERSLIELDQRIHRHVYRCTHNPFLSAALGEHYLLSLRIWFLALDRVEQLGDAVREHRELLEAIRDGDGDAAEAAMLRHVDGFEQAIRVVL